jgi:hypothetical protein
MTHTCSADSPCQWHTAEDMDVGEDHDFCSLQTSASFGNGKGLLFTGTDPQLPTKQTQLYKL